MRQCGILLSISSLPSESGIGTLGRGAYKFVDFLRKSGQHLWQILPLSPVSFGNSPYQSFSAFAFNTFYIDPAELVLDGLLKEDECRLYSFGNDERRVNYNLLHKNRNLILKKAAQRFDTSDKGYAKFCFENDFWLSDYAFFMAYKEKHNMAPLCEFEEKIKHRDNEAMNAFRKENAETIEFHRIVQYLFYRQWIKLKRYANDNGVHIIGDIPIYVAEDSSDVWAHPELFMVDCDMKAKLKAGCPPDDFSPEGQLWGNPVYNLTQHRKNGYDFLLKRFRQANELFDITRIDHFRGFYSFYGVPSGEMTAENGEWYRFDGEELMEKLKKELPQMKIIAEDLGFITPEIRERMEKSSFPGMKILQFGFDGDSENEHLPHNFTRNSVAYTGTHDNRTALGWVKTLSKRDTEFALDYFDLNLPSRLPQALIRAVLSSVSDTAIIPMQDYLCQGDENRMNVPSTIGDNWVYRITEDDMSEKLSERLHRLAALYARL